MPRGYPALNEVQKKEIIRRVTDGGEKVSELSKEYGVVSKTIYNLLGRKTNQSSAVLELSKLRRENEALLSIIGSLVTESKLGKKAYGYRRIAIALGVNHKRVHRVMKLFGIKARRSLNRQTKVSGSYDLSNANRHQNLFAKAVVNRPDQAWVSDFTYLPQPNSKFVYLATVLDA